MQQKRLLLALALSTAILFLWSYLLPVKPPQPQPSPASSPSPKVNAPAQQSSGTGIQSGSTVTAAPAVEEVPHRTLSISTPLYDAKIDSRGAEGVSWIIK